MRDLFDQRRYLIPFRSLLLPQIFTDTLVIGTGVAGTRAALAAAEHGDVIVLAKDAADVSGSAWAQGGMAAVFDPADSAESHFRDTASAGAGLCNAQAVRVLVEETPERIEELIAWGMRLDRDPDGRLRLGREGGHTRRRVVHSDGDATGCELMRCLVQALAARENIRVFERCFALDLLSPDGRRRRESDEEDPIVGAITHHPRFGLQIIWAKATILATGGAGQTFRETTNPKVVTGDGLAMAFRAGAQIADAEFIQFHPTTLYVAGATRSLISEVVRGEGGRLVDRRGQPFMDGHHEMGDLAPRDVVSRAIVEQLARTEEPAVYLDARHLGARFAERFPGLTSMLREFDLDPATDLIPVHPSAHYTIGGVWTDLDGRSSLPGLYACGEAACDGLHGANRLASNSLTEGLVFGRRAGAATEEMMSQAHRPARIISEILVQEHGELDLVDVRSSLRSAMWRNVGIERTGAKLDDVVDMCDFWARYTLGSIFDDPMGWETQNLLTAGALITRAARWREETRGVHCRLDHPASDDAWLVHGLWRRNRAQPQTVACPQPEEVPS